MRKFKIYLIIIVITSLLLFLINFVSNYFGERVRVYVTNKASIYSVTLIEDALRNEVVERIDIENLVIFIKDDRNVITNVNINTSQVNEILAHVNKSIITSIEALKEENISLPLGIIISDTLFGSTGPELKIRVVPMGNVVSDVVAEVSPYGINSSLLEVSIKVKVEIQTIIPLRRESVEVNFNIPLVMQVINSDVPLFYVNH